jgi:ketosteroid isomerase-like protein
VAEGLGFAGGNASYHGHQGIHQWQQDLREAWAEFRLIPEAYFDLGDHTLVFLIARGRGRHSDALVEMPIAHVVQWHDDKIVHFTAYANREEALRGLGVTQADLETIIP